jgi:CRISPR-associated endonuclease/helicase Cas3
MVLSMDQGGIHYWAKTVRDPQGRELQGIFVGDHCLNVGCVAEALVRQLPKPLQDLLPAGAVTLAALHDVGKISPGFQRKCEQWLVRNSLASLACREDWANHEPDHAKVSQWTLQKKLASSKLDPWAAIVGAHHGRIKGRRVNAPVGARECSADWETARLLLLDELIARFGPLPVQPSPSDALLWFVAGLITVADWIGSDENSFRPEGGQADAAERLARDAVQQTGWRPARFRKSLPFEALFPACAQPRPLQTAAMKHINAPGLYLIEAQMGSGKTEAALAAAYRLVERGEAGGLYFALPTQVTSNRIYERVANFLAHADAEPDARRLRLAHGTSWLHNQEPPPILRASALRDTEASDHAASGRSWFASSKRALLAPFGVGTIDQALLGIVAARHFFVRQFGLAGKVVILDEVHSYDLYTGTLLKELVRRLRELRCTVIILSATLTAARRRELMESAGELPDSCSGAYPLLTASRAGERPQEFQFPAEPPRSVCVTTSAAEPASLVEKVLARSAAGQCVLWVRNTVREAQETFRALRGGNCEGGPPIALLHSRFPLFRRDELETDWLLRLGKDGTSRPAGCVLVATQVVEQSVDIDADFLITDLAPTDMLLQRLGRLWRHERARPAGAAEEIAIHLPAPLAALDLSEADAAELKAALGPSGRVYAPYVLLRSLEIWRERTRITLPADIRLLLEATYRERADEPQGWRALRDKMEQSKNTLRQLALNNTNVWNQPALADEEGVQTRINSRPAVPLLLATQVEPTVKGRTRATLLNGDPIEADDYSWSFPVAKAIHWNLVRVPRYAVEPALRAAPAWLRLHVAGECALGLIRGGDIFWLGQDEPSGLNWHRDEGVTIPLKPKPACERNQEDDYESFE